MTTSVLFFFFQPQALRFLALPIICVKFDGRERVSGNLEISCETNLHFSWVKFTIIFFKKIILSHISKKYYFIIPMISIWTLFVPMIYLGLLKKFSNKLDDRDVKGKLGFFYLGFTPNKYYWY